MKAQEFANLLDQITTNTYTNSKLKISIDPFYEAADKERLTDAQVLLLTTALKQNTHIIEVDLSCNNLTDISAIALAGISTLKILHFNYNHITQKGFMALISSHLVEISLQESEFIVDDAEIINSLINNKTITKLNISSSTIPDEMVAQLIKDNNTIEVLSLGCGLTDEALEFLSENVSLKKLIINNNKLTDEGIKSIRANHTIETLCIYESNIGDEGAAILAQHYSLKELSLYNSNITKIGSKSFLDTNLKQVNIFNGYKHIFMSSREVEYFAKQFEKYQLEKLLEQQEYYQNLIKGKQSIDIHPNMNDIDSIQEAIDTLQNQWAKDEVEQLLIGDINYSE